MKSEVWREVTIGWFVLIGGTFVLSTAGLEWNLDLLALAGGGIVVLYAAAALLLGKRRDPRFGEADSEFEGTYADVVRFRGVLALSVFFAGSVTGLLTQRIIPTWLGAIVAATGLLVLTIRLARRL